MIQIDMQMPKNCIDCPACNEYLMCAIPCNGRGWGENDVKDFSQSRPEWCPMKDQPQIVRCENCKFIDESVKTRFFCGRLMRCVDGDWFCADGEWRGNNA